MNSKAKDWRANGLSIRDEMHASYKNVGETKENSGATLTCCA